MIKKSQKWMGGVPPWVYIFLCAMLLAPLVLRLSIEWTVNAQYYYGWSVPLLAAYLFYERTLDKPAPQPARFGAVAIGGILLQQRAEPDRIEQCLVRQGIAGIAGNDRAEIEQPTRQPRAFETGMPGDEDPLTTIGSVESLLA